MKTRRAPIFSDQGRGRSLRRCLRSGEPLDYTAVHEAGHCLGARLSGVKIIKATINPTAQYSGIVHHEFSRASDDCCPALEERVLNSLLGHAAELEFGFVERFFSDGHWKDYKNAEHDLKDNLRWDKVDGWALANGYTRKDGLKGVYLNKWGRTKFLSRADTLEGTEQKSWKKATRITKAEWKPDFDRAVRKARRLAKKYRAYIRQVAELLMTHRTLRDEQIPALSEYRTHFEDKNE